MNDHLTPGSDPCGADVAAYALGALEPAEAEAFRRHVASCTICAEELAAFERIVSEVASGARRSLPRRRCDGA